MTRRYQRGGTHAVAPTGDELPALLGRMRRTYDDFVAGVASGWRTS